MFKKQSILKTLILCLFTTFYQIDATEAIFANPDAGLIKFCRSELEKSIANSSKEMFNDSFVSAQERQELLKQAQAEVKLEVQDRESKVEQLFECEIAKRANINYTAILNEFLMSSRKCSQSACSDGSTNEQGYALEAKKPVSRVVLDDLRVLSGNQTSGLFNIVQTLFGNNGLAPVSTSAGFAAAFYALSSPETNKAKLEKRRAELLRLVANPELVVQLREQLNTYAKAKSDSFDKMLNPILPEPFNKKKHVFKNMWKAYVRSKIVNFKEYLNLEDEESLDRLDEEKDLELMQPKDHEVTRNQEKVSALVFLKKGRTLIKWLLWLHYNKAYYVFKKLLHLINKISKYIYSNLSFYLPLEQIYFFGGYFTESFFETMKALGVIISIFSALIYFFSPLYLMWRLAEGISGLEAIGNDFCKPLNCIKGFFGFISLIRNLDLGSLLDSLNDDPKKPSKGVFANMTFSQKAIGVIFVIIAVSASASFAIVEFTKNKNRLSAVEQLLAILDNLQKMVQSGENCEKLFFGQSKVFKKCFKNRELDFNKKIKQLTSRENHSLTYLPKYHHAETTSLFREFFKNLSIDLNEKVFIPTSKVRLDCFTPMHERIGEIDLLVSLAELVIKSKGKNAAFSVANFIHDSDRAIVDGKDTWNILINRENVVPNDVEIGVVQENGKFVQGNMVTAGNGCGKTAHILAVATGVYLAQCLGVAPAKSLATTPFDRFITQINTVDDPLNNKSLFRAQIRQFGEMVTEITNISDSCKRLVFVCLDESLSGTKPKYSGPLLAALVKCKLSMNKKFAMLFATHLEHLASGIETLSGGTIIPVKVKCNLDKSGHFESSTFQVEPGPSPIDSAFKVAEEEWSELMSEKEVRDLIDQAKGLFGTV